MPKLKTKKGAAKRFKLTGKGKVKMKRCKLRHILTNRSTKNKRKYRQGTYVCPADEANVKRMLNG